MKPESLVKEIEDMIDDSADYDSDLLRDAGFAIGHFFSKIEGLVIIIIIVGLLVITALEILYLSIPALHDNLVALEERNRLAGKTVRVLFRTAVRADERAEETDRNVMLIYLKMKMKVLILATIVIWCIININSFIDVIRRLFKL